MHFCALSAFSTRTAETLDPRQHPVHNIDVGDGRVRYARNGEVRLAYRVFGDSGPVLVWTPGWVVSNVDTIGEPDSPYARLIDLVTQSMQFVMFDRRGTGLSDPATHLLSLDERIDDLRAVIDTVGVERPVLVGSSEGAASRCSSPPGTPIA